MSADLRYDVVIVGSGFGGSVTAYRLAQAGWQVCVLERGKAYGPGDFARRPAEMRANFWDPGRGHHGLFDLWSFRHIEALVASGVGGGSLIYANMLVRKPERWFVHEDPFDGGYEHWPISRADLERHYDAVEQMLSAQRLPLGAPGYPDVPKSRAMAEAAARLGLDWELLPMAVSFASAGGAQPVPGAPIPAGPYPNLHGRPRTTCRLCGECCIGCNFGAKNTLDHTYLSAAVHAGADLRSRCEVRTLVAEAGGGFTVGYVEHRPGQEGVRTDTRRLPLATVSADRVVLAAGALGTPYLLLRNRQTLPDLGPALGTRFSGNGDLLSFLLRARPAPGRPALDPSLGPVITGALQVPDAADGIDGHHGRGHYVEDAGYPVAVDWLAETTSVLATIRRLIRFAGLRWWARLSRAPRSRIGADFAALIGDAALSSRSLPLLGMGRDVPDGRMSLRGDWLDIDWHMSTSKEYFSAVHDTMAGLAGALGARFGRNPLSRFGRVITVHPLGGCPMGRHDREGVVDALGEAFGCPGLFVVDGAAMPGPIGPNPSLTIAAFADRAAERMVERGRAAPGRRLAAGHRAGQAAGAEERSATSVGFTEEMNGYVTLGETDPERGLAAGRAAGTRLMFHLDMHIDDIDRFVDDPDHTATASGSITCEALGGQLFVEQGVFNLFVEGEDRAVTRMLYRLPTKDGSGRLLTLAGSKYVRDDPGFDVWPDTSTLHIRLLEGHVEPEEDSAATVVGAGVLRIPMTGFLELLRSMHADGPDPLLALTRFGQLFVGRLWDVYGQLARGG